MSRIKNDSFQTNYGEAITAGNVNNKYTDVATAVNNLDADNVRNEGIDRENITGTPVLKRSVYSFNNIRTNIAYSFRTDAGRAGFPTEVSRHQITNVASGGSHQIYLTDDGTQTGNPTTFSAGDLIRIHYSFLVYSTSVYADSMDPSIPEGQSSGFIIFPQYKSTSGGSWNTFPSKKDWDIYGDSGPLAGQALSINTNDNGDGSNEDDGIVVVTFDGATASAPSGVRIKSMQSHGAMNILLDASLQIHTIGWFIIGPVWFHDAAPFAAGSRGWQTIDTQGGTEVVRIERANYAALVLQKGKG